MKYRGRIGSKNTQMDFCFEVDNPVSLQFFGLEIITDTQERFCVEDAGILATDGDREIWYGIRVNDDDDYNGLPILWLRDGGCVVLPPDWQFNEDPEYWSDFIREYCSGAVWIMQALEDDDLAEYSFVHNVIRDTIDDDDE